MEQGSSNGGGFASGSSTPWTDVNESAPQPFPSHSSSSTHRFPVPDHSRYYPDDDRRPFMMPHRHGLGSSAAAEGEDGSSCVIVLVVFWIFAMTLVFGVYAPDNLQLGPNSSLLIKPNRLFVGSVKVLELQPAQGSMLYGFHENPPLNVDVTWSETHKVNLPVTTHKEWIYYLNKGSQISLSYSVSSLSSSSLVLVIGQGKEEFTKWLEDPSYPNSTLLWKIIHGNGTVKMNVQSSSTYYVGVGNLNFNPVQVELNATIRALLFNTTVPYYKCIPGQGECSFKLSLLDKNAAVLTTPGRKQGVPGVDCNVKISYEPRWMTYAVGVGGMTVLVIVISMLVKRFRHTDQDTGRDQTGVGTSDRNPLLPSKDEDHSSCGSSYGSDAEDGGELDAHDGDVGDGESKNSSRRACAICFNDPRDCFFIPCGHCVACFECASRINETSGACPICRRRIKKVRKIYTV